MDYLMYPNLMSREDLIMILKNRQLKIPNLEELKTEEIIKIYTKFALPLSQREQKKTKATKLSTDGNISNIKNNETFDSSKNQCSLKRNLPVIDMKEASRRKVLKLDSNSSKKTYFEFEQKRNLESDDEILAQSLDQCQQKLKRQKITWP
ncbi:uncharacterized protein LOC129619070 [Condylostylus longicornis]|uniref:uncharacterized protein LOC129619070 n=1 Tax=Condylostylus longicornis TaxID=2530218 RepID=UPI00244DD82D|nr:uncharacterized protein LOC129619070 [Condylostylus longicornis]XP_055390127.1 uncharacterized protein LOC129619070 [Condylostylus longicornis]